MSALSVARNYSSSKEIIEKLERHVKKKREEDVKKLLERRNRNKEAAPVRQSDNSFFPSDFFGNTAVDTNLPLPAQFALHVREYRKQEMMGILEQMKNGDQWKQFLKEQEFLVNCSSKQKTDEKMVYDTLYGEVDTFNLNQTWLNEELCNKYNIEHQKEYEICAMDISLAAKNEEVVKMLKCCEILQEMVGQKELKQFVMYELLLIEPEFKNYVLTGYSFLCVCFI